jgi:hypothetical protein
MDKWALSESLQSNSIFVSVSILRLRLTPLVLLSLVLHRYSAPARRTAKDQSGLRILVVPMSDKGVSVHITTSGGLSFYRIPPLFPLLTANGYTYEGQRV